MKSIKWSEMGKREKICSLLYIAWIVFFWGMFRGISVMNTHDSRVIIKAAAGGMVYALLICGLLILLMRLLPEKLPFEKMNRWILSMEEHCFVLLVMGLLLLAWLPAFLGLYPGTFGYDSPGQIAQYIGEADWSTYQPVLCTWLMGTVVTLGLKIFGTYNAGVAIYCMLQAVIVSFAEARAFLFMKRKKVPCLIILAGLFWMAVNPIAMALHFSMTKDILFGACLLYFSVVFLENFICRETAVQGRVEIIHWLQLVLSGTVMCLLRNQGVYMILTAVILLLLVYRRRLFTRGNLRMVLGLIAILVLTKGFNTLCIDGLHMKAGDKKEMFSVPMQQMARVAEIDLRGEKDLVNDQEMAEIEEIIPREGIEVYQYDSADPVKATFRTEQFLGEPVESLSLYAQVGMENPVEYVYAFSDMIVPYWDMNLNRFRGLATLYAWPDYAEHLNIYRDSKLPAMLDYLNNALLNERLFRRIPWKYIFSPSYSLWILIALVGLGICFGRRRVFFGQLFITLYFLTCLLGPVALLRYMYPIMIAMPFLIGLFFIREEE